MVTGFLEKGWNYEPYRELSRYSHIIYMKDIHRSPIMLVWTEVQVLTYLKKLAVFFLSFINNCWEGIIIMSLRVTRNATTQQHAENAYSRILSSTTRFTQSTPTKNSFNDSAAKWRKREPDFEAKLSGSWSWKTS